MTLSPTAAATKAFLSPAGTATLQPQADSDGKADAGADLGTNGGDPIVIKKYANRRLYDTDASSYITLDHLAQKVRSGQDFVVHDARTGEDITRGVLTQIIVEEESRGDSLLPIAFLRQLITLYGDKMQGAFPSYLDASMDSFRANGERLREAMENALVANPFAEMARRNMDLFAAVLPRPAPNRDEEVAALKRELAALRKQVDRLS